MQGYLTHKKHSPRTNLQKDYVEDSLKALGGGAVSYERGTPVNVSMQVAAMALPLIRQVSRPKPETPKPSVQKTNTHALRLRLEGLFGTNSTAG